MTTNNPINIHDRIDRMIDVRESYKNVTIEVVVSPDSCASYNGQVMTLVAAKLIKKWAKKLTVHIPLESACVINKYKGKSINDILDHESIEVVPYKSVIDISLSKNSLILLIGSKLESVADSFVWINSQGWLAGYGTSHDMAPVDLVDDSILGSSFAACLGVSELFRQAIGKERKIFSKWFSMYDYGEGKDLIYLSNPSIDGVKKNVGNIVQIGCGAIGSCFDYLVSLCNDLSGEFNLIDFDNVELQNVPASLVFSEEDATIENQKVDLCKKVFDNTGIKAYSFEHDYENFLSSEFGKNPDLILCFANERNIWSTIQHNYPPLVIHATTTKNWGINFGRHIPLKDWCIMCRFHEDVKQEFVPVCSEGNISGETENEVLGILPFLAAASSVLVIAELYRLQNPLQYKDNTNFIEFSMLKWEGNFLATNFEPKKCYVCEDQKINLYPMATKGSKYWQFAEEEILNP